MNKPYEDKFKRKIVQLHLEAGRSIAQFGQRIQCLSFNYSVWCKQFREGCKLNAGNKNEYEQMKMIQALNNRILELEKENAI